MSASASTDAARRAGTGFRADVQWLRAVSVLAVLAYHLSWPWADGGFVGVDVFFVVSGYLITRLLLAEHARTGTIDLRSFAARRVRRLLPVSTVVLVVSVLWMWSSFGVVRRTGERAVSVGAAAFGANVSLAAQRTDYLTAEGEPVLQHYWSLGVEEQFYLLWPMLLLGTLVVAARRRWRVGHAVLAVAVVVSVVSLAVAWRWTSVAQPLAFFLLPARAWELMAGVVVAALELAGHRPRARSAWRWIGLAAIGMVFVGVIDGGFPWPLALVPVLGTAAVLWAGAGAADDVTPTWMRSGAMRWIGDRSFGLYLWHWPPLVLLELTSAPWSSRPVTRVAVVVGTFLATEATYRWVEEPLRRGSLLAGHRRAATFLVAAVAGGVGLSLAATAAPAVDPGLEPATAEASAPAEPAPTDREPTFEGGSTLADDNELVPVSLADVPSVLPASVRLQLAAIAGEKPEIYANECHAPFERDAPLPTEACTYGDDDAAVTVALVGDSHAASWFPAGVRAATERGWRLVVMTKSGCSLYEVDVTLGGEREYPQCELWRSAVRDRLVQLDPDVVVVTGAAVQPDREDAATWADGVDAGLRRLRQSVGTTPLVIALDPPHVLDGTKVPTCLDERPVEACNLTRDSIFDQVQRATVEPYADVVLDAPSIVCDGDVCPAIVRDVVVYRDDDHFSAAFSKALAPVFADAVDRALR